METLNKSMNKKIKRNAMIQKVSALLKVGISFMFCFLFLSKALCQGQENSKKAIRLTADGWTPVVKQVGDERDSFGYQIQEKEGGLEFSITGVPGSPRAVKWTKEIEELNLGNYPYIILKYEANWLNSPGDEIVGLSIINANGISKDTTLLRMMDLIVDRHQHTMIIKTSKSASVKKMTVSLNTRSSRGYLFIKSIGFIKNDKEFSHCIDYKIPGTNGISSMQCIDIASRYNTGFMDLQKSLLNTIPIINDGGKYFSDSKIEINGIPFEVRPEGQNLQGFPPESKVNEEIIDHLGAKVRRGSVAPISRDDKIEISVKSPASEVFFLLAAENPRTSPRDPRTRIFMIEDIETFAVELVYEDGTIDFAFPYSIKDEKHIIQGTFGAYVVPASGKPLNKIIFHNRTISKNYYLGAVTINKNETRLFPQLISEPGPKAMQEPKTPAPSNIAPYLQNQNGIIKLGNSYVEMTIDARNGFTITSFNNKWLDPKALTISPTPGFQVALEENNVDIKDMKLLDLSDITGTTGKEITLNYGLKNGGYNLGLKIKVSVTVEPEIGMQMTAVNYSEKDLKAKIVFPIINGIQLGNTEDVWYYYPSVRNVFSNQEGTFDNIYSLSFPMQFYDVYNPAVGGGFYLATRETNANEMRRYGFRKNESGVSCYIEYPKLHTLLKSNVPDTLCKTIFGVHTGDWHVALDTYKQWLQTWYKPLNSQDKQWYRECFWLLCDYPDNIPRDALTMRQNFTWYDTIKKQYRMRDILDEHKKTVGRYPDILHFWSWTQNMPRGYSRWGAYGTNGEYDRIGGVKNFNRVINDIQKNMGVKISLYFDASLLNRELPIAKKIGSGGAMQKIGGGPVIDYSSYRMCPGVKEWRDYMQGVYRRVNKDLGVNVLYVDEWAPPFYNGHVPLTAFTCYSAEHDHAVPANMNLEVNTYMRELRTAVPKEAALYGEYPDIDVNARYYDSNITYYLATWSTDLKEGRDNIAYDLQFKDEGLSDPYLQLYKFVFPGLVQLSLPNDVMYFSWNRLKFTFLNCDAIYDSFWLRDESKAEAFMVRSHDLKLKYADCFTSNSPEPLVPTEKSGILVNKYPGKGRTLWAIYNQRYITVRGEILKVKHIKGTTYYDAWNDKPLQVRISGDYAFISLEMDPQGIGCIVQSANQ
jgi:hypothetical protein